MPFSLFLLPAGLLLALLILAAAFGRRLIGGTDMSLIDDLAPLFGDLKKAAGEAAAPLHSRIAELEHLVEAGKADLDNAMVHGRELAAELAGKDSEVAQLTEALGNLKAELVAAIAPPAPTAAPPAAA